MAERERGQYPIDLTQEVDDFNSVVVSGPERNSRRIYATTALITLSAVGLFAFAVASTASGEYQSATQQANAIESFPTLQPVTVLPEPASPFPTPSPLPTATYQPPGQCLEVGSQELIVYMGPSLEAAKISVLSPGDVYPTVPVVYVGPEGHMQFGIVAIGVDPGQNEVERQTPDTVGYVLTVGPDGRLFATRATCTSEFPGELMGLVSEH